MKKIVKTMMVAIMAVVCALSLNAQSFGKVLGGLAKAPVEATVAVPAGREVFPIILQYVKNYTEEGSSTCELTDLDVLGNTYRITQSVTFKFGIGLQKQTSIVDFSVTDDVLKINTVKMTNIGVDKNGKENSKPTEMSASSMGKNNENIAGEVTKLFAMNDDEYTALRDAAVLDPFVLNSVAQGSALKFKKFVENNGLIGKKITITVVATKVDEAPSYAKGYEYYLTGNFLCGYNTNSIGIRIPETAMVMFYTNDDAVADVEPVSEYEAFTGVGSKTSTFTVTGTIKDISRKDVGGLSIIQINGL